METTALSALLRKSRSAAKAVALPALLSTLGAGLTVLQPMQARAAVGISTYACTVFKTGVSDCINPTQLGDKKVTFLGFTINPVGGQRDVAISYEWLDNDGIADQDFSDDTWTFSVKNPAGQPAFSGPFTLTYDYRVDIVSGPDKDGFNANGDPWFFNAFGIDSDVPPLTQQTTAIKDVKTGTEVLNVTSVNGVPDGAIFAGNYKSVVVSDKVIVNATGTVFSVTNAWNQRKVATPGPLPLLGAGAAFGFSRRLKRRITASQAT